MCARFPALSRLVLPDTRTLALAEFLEAPDARRAFNGMAYKKPKHVPIYVSGRLRALVDARTQSARTPEGPRRAARRRRARTPEGPRGRLRRAPSARGRFAKRRRRGRDERGRGCVPSVREGPFLPNLAGFGGAAFRHARRGAAPRAGACWRRTSPRSEAARPSKPGFRVRGVRRAGCGARREARRAGRGAGRPRVLAGALVRGNDARESARPDDGEGSDETKTKKRPRAEGSSA